MAITDSEPEDSPSYLELCLREPFRLFFPFGIVAGILGVLLWPLFYAELTSYYPGIAHSRIMAECFTGAFLFGFFLTAWPRLIEAPRIHSSLSIAVALLLSTSLVAHLANEIFAGDLSFLGASLIVVAAGLRAYFKRQDLPPPGFVLGAAGILFGLIGALLLLLFSTGSVGAQVYAAGKTLLFQGFSLLPIIGVGVFFFPKLLGVPNRHAPAANKPERASYKLRVAGAAITAVLFLLSIILEATGLIWHAYSLRLVALVGYFLSELNPLKLNNKASCLGIPLRIALGTALIGIAFIIIQPALKIGWLHVYFIGGLTPVIILISMRVVFGHSGQRHRLTSKRFRRFAGGAVALLLIASISRISGDFMPRIQIGHYIYAAAIWIISSAAWLVVIAPRTRLPDPEDDSS